VASKNTTSTSPSVAACVPCVQIPTLDACALTGHSPAVNRPERCVADAAPTPHLKVECPTVGRSAPCNRMYLRVFGLAFFVLEL
jgi:hypothetical protein